jgi:hypothetical protein
MMSTFADPDVPEAGAVVEVVPPALVPGGWDA